MRQQKVLLSLLCIIVLGCLMSTEAIVSLNDFNFDAQPDPELQRYFQPEKSGWLGADVASSTSLGGDRYLWIWGDTLVGTMKSNQRVIKAMPRNSLATVDVANGSPLSKPKYHIRVNQTNINGGFFSPDSSEYWYWPVNGLMINDVLYIMSYTVYNYGSGSFGFAFQGTSVIRVLNPRDDPNQWDWGVSNIAYSNGQLNWASGIVKSFDEKYIYLYGSSTTQGTVLSRLTVDDFLQNKWTKQQFLVRDYNWLSFNATEHQSSLATVLNPSLSEVSVTYHSYLNAWITMNGMTSRHCDITNQVQSLVEFGGTKVLISVAEQLPGPWSEWYPIYDLPAPYNNTKQVFCYALKRHPEFERASNELVLTYMSNTYDVNDLKSLVNVYVPQFVRVKISKKQTK